MSVSRRDLLKLAGAASAAATIPGLARAQQLEKKDVTIAVGGQALIYYLPLSIAHINGYFKDEGLDAKIVDFAGGSKALQAVVGGSADVVSGAFEHTINLQSKGQYYRAFAQQGRAPMIVLAVSNKTMAGYKGPEDFKGKKIGVTAPGSSTNMMASFFLAQHGLKPSDVAFVGVGAGAGAITAMRTGQIDAIANLDPVISTLVKEDAVKIVADTRTLKDTVKIFGGNMPSGCLYASQEFIDKHPNTAQALANAIVRAEGGKEFGRLKAQFQIPFGVKAGGIAEDLILLRAAEQFIDRALQELALEVPERNIERADGIAGQAARPIGRSHTHHHIPELFSRHAILTCQRRGKVIIDHAHHRAAVDGNAEAGCAILRGDEDRGALPLGARERVAQFGIAGDRARHPQVSGAAGLPRWGLGARGQVDLECADFFDLHNRCSSSGVVFGWGFWVVTTTMHRSWRDRAFGPRRSVGRESARVGIGR